MARLLPDKSTTAAGTLKDKAVASVKASGVTTPDESTYNELENRVPRTVDELIKLRAQQEGHDRGIVSYPIEGTDYIDYSPKNLDVLVERAAAYYSTLIPQRLSSVDPVQVIGILGNSDLNYAVTFLAVSRLGHAALLLSTRITPEAYQSLLSSTKATTLLYQSQYSDVAQVVQSSLSNLESGSLCDITSLPDVSLKRADFDLDQETNNPSFIIHSSGSTGLPKPIVQTHKASLYSYSQYFGLVGHITLPLYHNHGICCFFRAIHSRRKIYIYNARLPLTSEHLLKTLREHPDIGILYGVPYALKLLSETDEGIELLSELEIVMFGGSACPKPIGDKLVERGVNLVGHYGATEVGQLMTSFRDHPSDKEWDWLRMPDRLEPYISMELRGPNLYELCVLKGWPSKVATNRDDGSYATKDLFEPHSEIPGAWRYYARLDDTLTLENGEKANPLLLEGVLRQSADVAEAVVFGAGKARLGAFIIRASTTSLSDDEIVEAVIPTIYVSNESSPAYARLSRDMIRILPKDAPYRRTDKGTVIRAAFYKDYASKIDEVYVDDTAGSLILSKPDLVKFLHQELCHRVKLDHPSMIKTDTDLFALGVDSLLAIQIRSFVLKTLKVDSSKLGRNFVFDFPTIDQMANEIIRLQHGGPEIRQVSVEQRMTTLIEKYSAFETHRPMENTTNGKHMVVTGVTGSLGAHVVSKLASQRAVSKIYCLVRASDGRAARRRVLQSLRDRLVLHTLSAADRSKIECIASDLSDEHLGLAYDRYVEISQNLTHVLHFAWSVNFNKALESFEKDCIAGAKNLMDLCLRAQRPKPAVFSFCSSVSTTVRTSATVVPESLPESLSYAQGMGYAQSKLITEHLCDRAARHGLETRVLRVGQIIGDTKHGVWNDTEAIPMIFQTAKTISALPKLDESPLWLPVDLVANSCIEISCSAAPSGVYNIVNHNSFHWIRDLLPLLRSAGLEFEELDQRQWVQRLKTSNPDPVMNPPIKLVDFFASKYGNDGPRRSLRWDNAVSQGYSPSLQNAGIVDATLMRRIVSDLSRRWAVDDTKQRPTAIFLCGPCGSGKTTAAEAMSSRYSMPVIEGDDIHSLSAKAAMRSGTALTDAERLVWLSHIRGAIVDRFTSSRRPAVLISCSALKTVYRDELRKLRSIADIQTVFIMLSTTDRNDLRKRLSLRKGHYMGASMVDAQLDILEAPQDHEVDTVVVDASQSMISMLMEAEDVVDVVLRGGE